MMVSSSGTNGTVMTGSPMSSLNAGVVAAMVIVVLLFITGVVCNIVFMTLYVYKKGRNENYVRTKQFEKVGDSNNSTNAHEELEVTACNTEDHKASNKENINLMPNVHPATCEEKDPTPNDKYSIKGNENHAFEYDDIDHFPSQPKHDNMKSDKIDNKVPPPDSKEYSTTNIRQRGNTLPQPPPSGTIYSS